MSSYYPEAAAASNWDHYGHAQPHHHHYYNPYFNQFQGTAAQPQQPQVPTQPPPQPQSENYSEKNEASKSPQPPYEAAAAAAQPPISDLARRMNCFNSEVAATAEAAALQAASIAASYDMYAGQPKMTSASGVAAANGNSFYPWMKNYNGKKSIETNGTFFLIRFDRFLPTIDIL